MAQFSVSTNFRPEIGIAEIPIYYLDKLVAVGILLKDGSFSCQITDSDLLAMIDSGAAQLTVNETDGHFFAEISIQTMNRSSSMG